MTTPEQNKKTNLKNLEVSGSVHFLGWLVEHTEKLWLGLGNLESALLAEDIRAIQIKKPVFIFGLARAGSTLLLEILASATEAVTHRYRDFPFVYIPFWNHWVLDHLPREKSKAVERFHGDGIFITPESPEAMEEMIWTAFFTNSHSMDGNHTLHTSTASVSFEKFYRDHIKKLLLVQEGTRYVTKNNYNLTRMEYLLKLFPDACFIIPVRNPVDHIASLMRQHAHFSAQEARNPKILRYMQRTCHFEFGLDLRPVRTGSNQNVLSMILSQNRTEQIQGWARYWKELNNFVEKMLEKNPALKGRTLLVGFEDLCRNPEKTLDQILTHTALTLETPQKEYWISRIKLPDYYRHDFNEEEIRLIQTETGCPRAASSN